MSQAPRCARCGGAGAAPVALTTVRAAGPWSRLAVDDRPRCGPCARGPGLRALVVTGLLGWWGWPGLRQAPAALRTTARDLAQMGALPRALAVALGVAGHLVPLAMLAVLGMLAVGLGSDARAAVAEAERLSHEGVALLERGQPEAALERFREALDRTPGVPALCFNAGQAAQLAGRAAEAEQRFRAAIANLAPEQDARYERPLGELLLGQGRAGEALSHLERAVALAPDDVQAHRALQDALRGAGRAAEVAPRWATWRREHPGSADACYLHARAIEAPAERAAVLQEGLALAPEHFWCHLALGDARLQLGDPGSAREAFARAAAADRGAAKPVFGLLRAELAAGDRAAAAVTVERLRREFPRSPVTQEAEALFGLAPVDR